MMPSNGAGLTSARSSLISLHDVIEDDRSIARELLQVAPSERPLLLPPPNFQGFDRTHIRQQDTSADGYQDGRARRANGTSNTWTSSDGGVLSDQDEIDDRIVFVEEYNRLAKKHGVRAINDDWGQGNGDPNSTSPKTGWLRRILRRTSSSQSIKGRPDRSLRHRRSISDLSLRLKLKKDKLKDKDLQELVRLCGASILYLPAEYAAGSLSVPTCFRATAQYLVQYGTSARGIFRIPGSHSIVSTLYNYYCATDEYGQVISGTVRNPTLPDHIRCDVHDVASTFKKFLSGLPGGILGSLQLLDAFISIQSQLAGHAESTRTKQSKVRARLIALAIATLRSQYRRELICAVFGLLCMIGRTAETAQREDTRGRPLPTSDLMGYGPLGIVFGPLLVGDLLEDYSMRLADPHKGLVLLPITPPKSRKERQKKTKSGEEGSAFNTHVDKIKIVNSITEMLITHWRDVIRHMRNLSALKTVASMKSLAVIKGTRQQLLRPSASESFALRKPPDWTDFKAPITHRERSESPTPAQRLLNGPKHLGADKSDALVIRKQRSGPRPMSSQRLSGARSMNILSPTLEENSREDQAEEAGQTGLSKSTNTSLSNSDDVLPTTEITGADAASKGAIQFADFSFQESPSQLYVAYDRGEGKENTRSPSPSSPIIPETISRRPVAAHPAGVRDQLPAQTVARSLPLSETVFQKQVPYLSKTASPTHQENTQQSAKLPVIGNVEKIATLTPRRDIGNTTISYEASFVDGLNEVDEAKKTASMYQTIRSARKLPRVVTPAANAKPKVIFSASMDITAADNKTPRRIGASEPGLQPVNTMSDRRVSRSLYEDPARKRNLMDWSTLPFRKDPLARISQQEDVNSLISLAEAIGGYEEPSKSFGGSGRGLSMSRGDSASDSKFAQVNHQATPKVSTVAKKIPREAGSSSIGRPSAVSRRADRSSIVDFLHKDQSKKRLDGEHESSRKHVSLSSYPRVENSKKGSFAMPVAIPARTNSKDQAQRSSMQQEKIPNSSYSKPTASVNAAPIVPIKPSAFHGNKLNLQPTNTASNESSPSKISALVARFNTNSAPLVPVSISPTKTINAPVKPASGIQRDQAKSPGGSLIAAYTTNKSSPSKSQKSAKSEKSPLTRRSPFPQERTPKYVEEPSLPERSTACRALTPRRVMRMSLYDEASLRLAKPVVVIQNPSSAETSPQPSVVSRTQSIRQTHENRNVTPLTARKVSKLMQDPSPTLGSVEPSRNLSSSRSIPKFYEDSFTASRKASLAKSTLKRRLSQDSVASGSTSPRKVSLNPSQPKTMQTDFKAAQSFLSKLGNARPASPREAFVDVPAFDGPGSRPGSVDGSNDRRASAPMANQPYLADFVHPESPFRDTFAPSFLTSPSGSPSQRGDTLLFKQVRNLRQQLNEKTEQIRQLHVQVENLRTIDTHRCEALTEARREAKMWRGRAETAEVELEALNVLETMSSISYSTRDVYTDELRRLVSGRRPLGTSEQVVDGSHAESVGIERGLEFSEESTGTVLRDVDGAVGGTEYSLWAGE